MDDLLSRVEQTRDAVEVLLDEPAARLLLEAYYDPAGRFAASTFETLGRNDPEVLGDDDLLAITLLDVRVPPDTIRQILGADSASLSEGLRAIGSDTPLWKATDRALVAAGTMWDSLRKMRGIDWVTAGKLLARKRPMMIPVVDKWTIRVLPAAKGEVWTTLRLALDDKDLRKRIEKLRPRTASSATPTLRLLDALLWIRHSESSNARAVRQAAGLEVRRR